MNRSEVLLQEFNERYARSLTAASELRRYHIVVLGAGAVGSLVGSLLTDHGCSVAFVDRDRVEPSNQSRHVLRDRKYVGQPKATALAEHLASQHPALQVIRGVVADIGKMSREELEHLFAQADLIIAATGRDDLDRVMDHWARWRGVPIVFPSMWAGERSVLGDVLVVPWNLFRTRRGVCFSCLRPPQAVESAPAEAQPGLETEVLRVASFTVDLALALLLEGPTSLALMRNLARGANYFLVPRWPPSLRAVRTQPRRDCSTCSTGRLPVPMPRVADDLATIRDWSVAFALSTALLWHGLVPGFDFIATALLIVAGGFWWRDRLPTVERTSTWLRRNFWQ